MLGSVVLHVNLYEAFGAVVPRSAREDLLAGVSQLYHLLILRPQNWPIGHWPRNTLDNCPLLSYTEGMKRTRPEGYNERAKLSMRRYRDELRQETFLKYGNGHCARCGIPDTRVLTLHHTQGGGNSSRKSLVGRVNGAGWPYYAKLKKLGWPPGLQVLCHNCHHIVEFERSGL